MKLIALRIGPEAKCPTGIHAGDITMRDQLAGSYIIFSLILHLSADPVDLFRKFRLLIHIYVRLHQVMMDAKIWLQFLVVQVPCVELWFPVLWQVQVQVLWVLRFLLLIVPGDVEIIRNFLPEFGISSQTLNDYSWAELRGYLRDRLNL